MLAFLLDVKSAIVDCPQHLHRRAKLIRQGQLGLVVPLDVAIREAWDSNRDDVAASWRDKAVNLTVDVWARLSIRRAYY